MATLKDYLKTVQELEVNLYISKLIYAVWNQKYQNLIEEHEERIERIESEIQEKNHDMQRKQYEIDNVETLAKEKYSCCKPKKPSYFLSYLLGSLMGLAFFSYPRL